MNKNLDLQTIMTNEVIDYASEIQELLTLRDVLRYMVSTFVAADVHHGHGATNALDEAAFLILASLHLPVDDFNVFADSRLTKREKILLGEHLRDRIEKRRPAAYIVKKTWLNGYSFRTDERALVPRSYISELLFSPILQGDENLLQGDANILQGDDGVIISQKGTTCLIKNPNQIEHVLDLCTGGGSLAILAAHAFPQAIIDAVDLSPEALALAAQNIADYGLESRMELFLGDLFAPVAGQLYDLIITNPPYVDYETMMLLPPEFQHEPKMALAGGEDGLDLVRRIIDSAAHHLKPGGGLLCEIGLGRDVLEQTFPDTPFLWLDTETSEAEVFWLQREQMPA